MILEQFYLSCLAQASYGIACQTTKVAAIVDPRRDVQIYLDWAETHGLRIEHVLLTHMHADFLAGHIELRERVGATIHLGRQAQVEYSAQALADGDVLKIGEEVELRVLETPGHTPESVCYAVHESGHDAPHALLSGDTLFIGDVGRPDLMASVGLSAEELGSMLYDSIQRLLELPDATLLYPGHGAGSLCGKSLSKDTVSTIGCQRTGNYALQPMSREEFVAQVTSGQGSPPAYFGYDARLNRVERPTLEANLEQTLKPLSLAEVLRLQGEGAVLLDTRDPDVWAAEHLRGSVNVGLGGKYATWAGTVLHPEAPLAIVAEPGREREAATRLGRIGFDRLVGYLEGGPSAFTEEHVVKVVRVEASALRERLAGADAPRVLDVRNPGELEGGAISGSLHVPLGQLRDRIDEIPREGALVVHCRSGYRSAIACSLLEGAGLAADDLAGGYMAWAALSTS